MAEVRDPMLLVASDTELPPAERVWGTGGWLPPAAREALDWLTLARLCGWAVTVTWRNAPRLDSDLAAGSRWVVLACDPDSLDEEVVRRLAARLETEPVLVVARAASPDRPLARLAGAARQLDRVAGRSLGWFGPGGGRSWGCRRPLVATTLVLWATPMAWAPLDGRPVIRAG